MLKKYKVLMKLLERKMASLLKKPRLLTKKEDILTS